MARMSLAAKAAAVALTALAGSGTAQTPTPPNPILYMTGTETYTTNAGTFVRYRYDILNKASYPAAMFAAAPTLPPCGNNANASRSWIDFFNGRTNQRIYGFCALSSPQQLGSIWFALPEGAVPPSYVYVELIDRQTGTRYRSNVADTTL